MCVSVLHVGLHVCVSVCRYICVICNAHMFMYVEVRGQFQVPFFRSCLSCLLREGLSLSLELTVWAELAGL